MKTGDRVTIHSTNSPLDGLEGRLLGNSVRGLANIWIVGLSEPYNLPDEKWHAVTITESCLRLCDCGCVDLKPTESSLATGKG